MKRILLFSVMVFGYISTAVSQCPPPEAFIKIAKEFKNGYSISSQSKTGNLKAQKSCELVVLAQAGMDYRFTVAAQNAEFSVNYEIYEMVTQKYTDNGETRYKKVKNVLFTSTNPEEFLEFTTETSRKLYISITLNGGKKDATDCVGVLIEQKPSAKIGF